MLPRPRSVRVALATLCSCVGLSSHAADWPQWLGPNRDGVWKEDGIVDVLPPGGPKELWRKPIAGGYAGPAVVGDRLYVTDRVVKQSVEAPRGLIPGNERIHCLNARTGETIWIHEYDRPYRGVDRPMGPRTTPVVAGDRLYTLGSMGDLVCLHANTGIPVWKTYFPEEFKTRPPVWGYSAHLLLHDGLVFALVGGDDHAVVAFDAATGEKKWNALSTKDVGYSPPMIVQAGGTDQLVVWLSDLLAGLDPKTGKVHWKFPHPRKPKTHANPSVTIVTPKIVGNTVYISSAYDGPLAVSLASDKPTATIAMQSENVFPKPPEHLAVLMTTVIAKGEHLYGLAADTGEILCVKAGSFAEVWRSKDLFGGKEALFGSAFWVEQGDNVFCFTDAGDLVTLKLNPQGYRETSRAHIMDPVGADRGRKVIWAHPAFANKAIIVRNEKEIIAYSLAK